MKNQKASEIYEDVMISVNNTLDNIESINLKKEENIKQISKIKDELYEISSDFSDELIQLQEYSEWEKFTIAFFGETNAGKSTIIESLRIALNESGREEIIHNNQIKYDLKREEYYAKVDSLLDNLDNSYNHFKDSILEIEKNVEKIKLKQNKLLNPKRLAFIYLIIFVAGLIMGKFIV